MASGGGRHPAEDGFRVHPAFQGAFDGGPNSLRLHLLETDIRLWTCGAVPLTDLTRGSPVVLQVVAVDDLKRPPGGLPQGEAAETELICLSMDPFEEAEGVPGGGAGAGREGLRRVTLTDGRGFIQVIDVEGKVTSAGPCAPGQKVALWGCTVRGSIVFPGSWRALGGGVAALESEGRVKAGLHRRALGEDYPRFEAFTGTAPPRSARPAPGPPAAASGGPDSSAVVVPRVVPDAPVVPADDGFATAKPFSKQSHFLEDLEAANSRWQQEMLAPPRDDRPRGPVTLAEHEARVAAESNLWDCEGCTYRNGGLDAVCAMCDTPAPERVLERIAAFHASRSAAPAGLVLDPVVEAHIKARDLFGAVLAQAAVAAGVEPNQPVVAAAPHDGFGSGRRGRGGGGRGGRRGGRGGGREEEEFSPSRGFSGFVPPPPAPPSLVPTSLRPKWLQEEEEEHRAGAAGGGGGGAGGGAANPLGIGTDWAPAPPEEEGQSILSSKRPPASGSRGRGRGQRG
jgi:hypothetical protein